MANMYRSVLSGGGTAPTGDAVAADVLSGKTFSNAQSTGISGTMVNNGAVSGVATPSQPYTVPEGYHNGNGTVTANIGSLTYQRLTTGAVTSYTFDDDYTEVIVSSFYESGGSSISYNGTGTSKLNTTYNRGAATSNLLVIADVKSGDTITITGGSGIVVGAN